MKIETREEYETIPDGQILRIFYSGDNWDQDYGHSVPVVKVGDRLYTITDFSDFSERNDCVDGYEFELAYNEKDAFNLLNRRK